LAGGAKMQNLRFDHIHLYSPDPHKTAEFYVKTLGAEKLGSNTDPKGRTVVDLILNGISVKISDPWDPAAKNNYGLDHFGMITDNLDAAIAELKSQGVKFVMEKTHVPTANISFFSGPENVLIEVVEKAD
jgi:catechol 2,3-dioxygenase-like lactoylglutathione lyase family enzyme